MSSYKKPQVIARRDNLTGNRASVGAFANVGIVGKGSGGVSSVPKTVIRSAEGLSDPVDPNMKAADCSYLGFKYLEGVDYEVTSEGNILWKSTKISNPYLMKVLVADSGSLPVGEYFYAVTAITAVSTISFGETLPSNVFGVTLGSVGKAVLNWSEVELADGYKIYRGSSPTNLTLIREISGGNTTVWEDTGIFTPGTVTPPASNTAYKRPPTSEGDTKGYWSGGDASDNLAALAAVDDGSLKINADGRGEVEVVGIDFTGLDGPDLNDIAAHLQSVAREQLGDRGFHISGSVSLNLNALKGVSNGRLNIKLDGGAAVETADIDLTAAETLAEVAGIVQTALQSATSSQVTCVYDVDQGIFIITSAKRGSASKVELEVASTGTDLRLSPYLDFVSGAGVVGVPYPIEIVYVAVSSNFVLTSAISGDGSSVVVSPGDTGTDLSIAGLTALAEMAGGSGSIGVTGQKVVYDVTASIVGQNFFEVETFFDLISLGLAHGFDSDLYNITKKMMAEPPQGFGAPMVTVVAVPELTRSSVGGALQELSKVDVDMVCAISNDVDISRDVVAHAVYNSRDDIKKERVAIVSLDASKVSYNDYIMLAQEFSTHGDRVVLVFDNYTHEPFVSPLFSAMQAALPDRATSTLTGTFITDLPIRKSGRVDGNAETYILSQGVLVVSKNEENVLSVIDDVTCGGPSLDLPGRLVEDYLRKTLRRSCSPLKGLKIRDRVRTGVEEIARKVLDSFTFTELIDSWLPETLVASPHPTNPEGVLLRFQYVRNRTLKIIEIAYDVLG